VGYSTGIAHYLAVSKCADFAQIVQPLQPRGPGRQARSMSKAV
jgi:hypothetical protein